MGVFGCMCNTLSATVRDRFVGHMFVGVNAGCMRQTGEQVQTYSSVTQDTAEAEQITLQVLRHTSCLMSNYGLLLVTSKVTSIQNVNIGATFHNQFTHFLPIPVPTSYWEVLCYR